MTYTLYDYMDGRGKNDIKAWTKKLQKKDKAKLNARLDMLKMKGDELWPQILTGTDTPGIQKLRAHGNVQLRPMLCNGPIDTNTEYTLLIGAIERNSKLIPTKADQKADKRKKEIVAGNNNRCTHERIS